MIDVSSGVNEQFVNESGSFNLSIKSEYRNTCL